MNKLMLSKDLYEIQAIKKATDAFVELVQISVQEDENYYVCLFEKCIYSQEQTIKEFENYLIDLCNTRES